jgi:predicted MPP superfamily phosphohydrolase
MKFVERGKERLSKRISAAVSAGTPLRELASNISVTARHALAEADTLIVETVRVHLKRLPKNLDGWRIAHLSDIHHSPFTSLEHISRAVRIANELKPDMVVLTGDFVSHEREYIEPMAQAMGQLKSEFGTFACLGNHDHRTDAGACNRQFAGGKHPRSNQRRFQVFGARRIVLARRHRRLYGRAD